MGLKNFFLLQCKPDYIRLRIGHVNFYLARHAMTLIKFEKKAHKKRRRDLKRLALERGGARCEICGCELDWKSVSIHHIKPKMTHPELEFDPANVQALCLSCHQRIHEIERLEMLGIRPAMELT